MRSPGTYCYRSRRRRRLLPHGCRMDSCSEDDGSLDIIVLCGWCCFCCVLYEYIAVDHHPDFLFIACIHRVSSCFVSILLLLFYYTPAHIHIYTHTHTYISIYLLAVRHMPGRCKGIISRVVRRCMPGCPRTRPPIR